MRLLLAFASALLAIFLTTLVSVQTLRAREAATEDIASAYELRSAVRRVLLLMADAETGQRGYLLTGRGEYLLPYADARRRLRDVLEELSSKAQAFPGQPARAAEASRLVNLKLGELNEIVDLYRRGETSLALAGVEAGTGMQLMEHLRRVVGEMNAETEVELERRRRASDAEARRALLVEVLSALVLLILAVAAALVVRGDLRRREEIARERARIFEYQERLISIVGHDLRNPLSAILLSSQSLLGQSKTLTEGQVVALQRVRRSATRINALAGLLIDFTHARLGHGLPISKAQVDARELVEKTVDELRAAHPEATVGVEIATGNPVGFWDAERLAQLVVNLASNALRYGRDGTAVTVALADAPGDALEIRVHNHGEPIPADLLPRLFEPYQRGPRSSELHQGGLGLGLFIVREIVRAHGGAIEACSTAGDGTTFVARLPRRSAGASGAVAQAAAPGAALGRAAT